MKKHFNKELVMGNKDNENFDSYAKCCICHNTFVEGNVKIRDHCHVIEKYRGAAHRDCNIKVKLNYKVPFVFYNLKNYDHILLCKNLAHSILKQMSYVTD